MRAKHAILGANIFRDFFAPVRDIVGGRSGGYEAELRKAKDIALGEIQEQAEHLGPMRLSASISTMEQLARTAPC